MKHIFKKNFKRKKSKYSSQTINDALGSSSEPATSTSTIKASTADHILSVPANTAAASAQVIQVAGVTAAHDLVSTSVSASVINEPDVIIPVAGVTAAHDLVSTLVSASVINEPDVSIPVTSVT
ncbi:hypothetical protein BYT27DRAFT_6539035 [Phlegmacium glaucopus]|nr:hypothetical protein BYT27DRAFT_6539035 [Phlegmacium glaucopus]